jgi:Protein of unknown function (DUF4231)
MTASLGNAMTGAELEGPSGKDSNKEPEELASLILEKAGQVDSAFGGFVKYRFRRPLSYSLRWSSWYGHAFTTLSVLAIAAGLGSSVLATAGKSDVIVAVLGIVVAVATAINRLWRPGLRGVVRHRTANALRREGWDFVCGRGNYDPLEDDEKRCAHFIDEVQRICASAELVDEQAVETE